MNREQKKLEIVNLAERLDRAKALIFAGYRGLKVAEMTELRSRLHKGHSTFKVVKNRLMKRILKERGLQHLEGYFTDPTALASSETDPVIPAKILVEFAKGSDKLQVKGGFLDGRVLSRQEVEALARTPSREVLLARALGSMQAPATNMVGVLVALPRKLLYALQAIMATKE